MVLKEKEDLCNWFKVLPPRKRIDYMCGLLHLCLPLELRFIGTVLEDIAKKDFNHLRDAENKANDPSELSNDELQSLGDQQFRAKIHVSLALMHSADSSCADILFRILEKQFNNMTNYFQEEKTMEEIFTLLTLACHHPAFKIHQRLRLGEILESSEGRCRHDHRHHHHHQQWNSTYQHLPPKTFPAYPSIPVSSRSPKGITSIMVHDIKDEHQNKKSGPDYEIHTTWSNGEISQHFMRHKELQNLHHQIFNKFSDEKKLHSLFPSPQGQRRCSKDEQKLSMNSYLSELSKAHTILSCDIVTRAFHNGKPMGHPVPVCPTYYYPAYLPEPEILRCPPYYVNTVNMVGTMPATGVFSSTNSPANSRSSSPGVMVNNNKSINPGAIADTSINHMKTKNMIPQQTASDPPPQIEHCQLLDLLGLQKYSENLANYTVQEICSMNSEEVAKLGLPPEVQMKLQSRLDQPKYNQDINGLRPALNSVSKQELNMHSSPAWRSQGHLSPDPGQQMQSSYVPFRIISPQPAIQSQRPPAGDSPLASESCTPSLSPGLHSMTDSPTSSLASPTSIYFEDKTLKGHQVIDSSGSDDDKVVAGPYEGIDVRVRGPGRPQQSLSLPLLNAEKGKVVNVPSSVSAPMMMNNETARDGGTPPVVNGFASESPFLPNANYIMLHQQQMQQRYKSAQPTHTGPRMLKNVVNMPCLDVMSQPPPLGPPGINKSNGGISAVMHPAMLQHQYIMPPNLQTNSGMIHSPQPTNGGPPQQLPAGQAMLPPALASDNHPFVPTIVPNPNLMPPHSRSILTTMSNSTGMNNTAPSHPGGQHPIAASHSPSPVALPADPGPVGSSPPNSGGVDASDSRQEESSRSNNKASPPGHFNNGIMSQIPSKTGPCSGTPSPPLPPKQNVTSTISCESSNLPQYMYMIPNMSHYPANPHPQNSLQHFPNGITPDIYHLQATRFPMQMGSGQMAPVFYGSQAFTSNVHIHQNASNPLQHHTASNGGNNSNTKSSCYNCGQSGHKGNECKEIPMESMTNSFKLNIKPKSDSE